MRAFIFKMIDYILTPKYKSYNIIIKSLEKQNRLLQELIDIQSDFEKVLIENK